MKLLVNGDSFAFGDGLLPDGDPGPWERGKHGYHSLQHNWPRIVADRLGWDLYNLSLGLGGNDRMIRTTMDHICRHGGDDLLVIFAWSEIMRRELHCIDHPFSDSYEWYDLRGIRWMRLSTGIDTMWNVPNGDEWQRRNLMYGWDTVESLIRFSQQVLLISSWLRSRNIPYLHLTGIARPIEDYASLQGESYGPEEVRPIFESIDWSEWMIYNGSTDNCLIRMVEANNMQLPCLHPTHDGHKLIADAVLHELETRF